MSAPEMTFWSCVLAVAYNYAGYPVVLFLLSVLFQAKSDLLFVIRRGGRRSTSSSEYMPRVAVLMSAYNEEAVIEAKVKNTLETDYPADRLEFFVGLDAPSDSTPALLRAMQVDRLRCFHFQDRRGKLGVLKALAQQTSAEILVITDANTRLEPQCIGNLVRHFADPRVGAVSGEESRVAAPGTDPSAEGSYWRYESALKLLENRLNCTLGGNGSVLAVRRSLFHPRKQTIIEDFQIPLEIRLKGYRVVYDPEAVATEEIAPTFSAQFARRVRIGAGNYQTLLANLECLDPRKGLLAFCFFSHRVLRWLAPLLLLTALVCSVLLAGRRSFAILLAVQGGFYLLAGAGYLCKKQGKPIRYLSAPLHFCSMNLALLLGLFRFLLGQQNLTWNSTPRAIQTKWHPSHGERRRKNRSIAMPPPTPRSNSGENQAFQET